ncbi:ATPase [Clostridium novyi]|uniref:ATPase n=1 Tax=Clostridium novyi TaxID=1542 RepID=UPI000A634D97|nr:ATPase [Clostridium novyi]
MKLLKNAHNKADEEYKRILNTSKEEANRILEEAISKAKEEALPIIQQGEKEVQEIKSVCAKKRDEAVNLVIERIVNINGNS